MSATATLTFAPVADAHVNEDYPTSNYATVTTLRVRLASSGSYGSYHSYLKFAVSGITASVTSATLRLFVTDPSPRGGSIFPVDNSWTETGITWQNAPAIPATPLATLGAVTTGTWVEFPIDSSITADGTYSFAITSPSGDSVLYSSREGTNPPQLLVTTDSSPPPPPSADFSGSPTSGTAPLAVQFTDASTGNPTGWSWNFGDNGTSTVPNPSHTYQAAGTYTVSLTVTNAGGQDTMTKSNYISVAAPTGDPVFTGAGDIASCANSNDSATAALLRNRPGSVFTAGDNAYEDGTAAEYANCYDPTWGAEKARTYPVAGNREYQTTGASGYFGYFGTDASHPTGGYYSFTLGTWHIIVLNSNCTKVACKKGSAQETWLKNDLAANPSTCTLAIWHHPRFSDASTSGTSSVAPFWNDLYAAGAEVIINGHAHVYERWAALTPSGALDPTNGIREFIVGTGGRSHGGLSTRQANDEVRDNTTYGVLALTLHATSYEWQFVPVAGGKFADSGTGSCH